MRGRAGVGILAGLGGVMLLFVGLLVVVGLVFGGCAISGYNKAIHLEEEVDAQWAQVENQLQRRFDLIPNLVETVKGYASHEKEIFENIAEARTKYFAADKRGEKIAAAGGIERALSRLLVLRETYPQLKAQTNFLDLQTQLEGTENRLSVARKRYNDAVRNLNRYCRGFFGRIWCSWAGVEPAEYFEVEEAARETPKVDFSGGVTSSARSGPQWRCANA